MNTLLLQPTDVLFFRDGRPMGGSLAGHGAAWPLPTVTNAALHAALWRSQDGDKIANVQVHGHSHHSRTGDPTNYARKFGSLQSAGPFPVINGDWLFPRPLDSGADRDGNDLAEPISLPLSNGFERPTSSLSSPLKWPVASTIPPSKKAPKPWWNASAWDHYLHGQTERKSAFYDDKAFAETEFSYGIGIDPETGAQDGKSFYTAHYLRLRDDSKTQVQLGLFAEAHDKVEGPAANKRDLIAALFPEVGTSTPVVIGGQQRVCTVKRKVESRLRLPHGKISGFTHKNAEGRDTWLVKWILLTPAIWPEIVAGTSKRGTERKAHPGGWLPNWIDADTGQVLLHVVNEAERRRRRQLNYLGKGYATDENANATSAKLVAAIVGKPTSVTGYALPHEAVGREGGAKPTHLAVPAGSVYYFQAESEDAACELAATLNWHGADRQGTTLKNRRSTLFGEKGFGLGVCGTWSFHSGKIPI